MVDKEYSDAQEKIEPITYSPEVQDTIEVKEVCFSLRANLIMGLQSSIMPLT